MSVTVEPDADNIRPTCHSLFGLRRLFEWCRSSTRKIRRTWKLKIANHTAHQKASNGGRGGQRCHFHSYSDCKEDTGAPN